jgi:hypothetical protein
MPSPNFDSLHLYLSRKIVDPVAAAGTDGGPCSSAMRTDYLNRANRLIQNVLWKSDADPDYPIISRFLQGLIGSSSFVFSTSGADLPSDYSRPLWVDGSMRLFYREPSVWSRVLSDDARFYNSMFTVYGNKIYGTFGGAALGTGNGVLYYVKSDVRVSSGDTLDIAIDSIWWDILVDIAASMYNQDRGNTQFVIQDPAALILSVVK